MKTAFKTKKQYEDFTKRSKRLPLESDEDKNLSLHNGPVNVQDFMNDEDLEEGNE